MAHELEADHHGHSADSPREIPRAGWWSLAKRVYSSNNAKNLSLLAAGIAFYAMLAIFPALAALVAIYGLLANPATIQHEINAIRGVIPGEAQNLIATYLTSIVSTSPSKLGIGLIVSILVALYYARSGTVSLIEALNVTYEEREKRGVLHFELVAMLIMAGAGIFVIIALLLIAAWPAALRFLPFSGATKTIGAIAPWPILIAMLAAALATTYRFAPSRSEVKWRWVSGGAVAASALWIAGSAGFTFYVAKFGNYGKSFGALGAVVVLLTWLYLTAYAILIGACLDAEMERQTTRDTTRPPERPMGRGGAKMTDTAADDDHP
ncbi:MAG: YihY/virulence factor BrkB family protein [Candidatus Binataceae bacterium]